MRYSLLWLPYPTSEILDKIALCISDSPQALARLCISECTSTQGSRENFFSSKRSTCTPKLICKKKFRCMVCEIIESVHPCFLLQVALLFLLSFSLISCPCFCVFTSKISSRQTSMRQWPAWGCCCDSSWRRIFSFCTRSLLYLGTVRHSASSGSWAGDRTCWGPPGPPCSFNWLGRLEVQECDIEGGGKTGDQEGMEGERGGKREEEKEVEDVKIDEQGTYG